MTNLEARDLLGKTIFGEEKWAEISQPTRIMRQYLDSKGEEIGQPEEVAIDVAIENLRSYHEDPIEELAVSSPSFKVLSHRAFFWVEPSGC